MTSGERMPSPNSPMAVARILAAERQHLDTLTLRHWRGAWMTWTGSHWIEIETAALRSELYKRLEGCHYLDKNSEPASWLPNRIKIANLLESLSAVTHLTEKIQPPTWAPHRDGDPVGTCVACTNGILDVATRTLHLSTPRYYNTVAVPFAYQRETAPPDRWLTFLDEIWPDDPDSIAVLQEWFGYVISGRTDLQKMLMLIGPTRSGKGTIARILAQLAGSVAGPSLLSLGTDFGLAPLLGKSLAIVSDARLGRGNHIQTVVERLLSISGEDILDVNRKYRDQWTGKLGTRMMILSNEIPQFGDESAAISGRFVVLTMSESFLGREDHELYSSLCEDLPGILEWSLQGLDRLTLNGYFATSEAGADAARTLRDLASPISAFIQERCTVGDHTTGIDAMWAGWKEWAEEAGVPKASKQWLGRSIRAALPRVRTVQRADGTGKRYRAFSGVELLSACQHADDTDARAEDFGISKAPDLQELPLGTDNTDILDKPTHRENSPSEGPIYSMEPGLDEMSVLPVRGICPSCDALEHNHLPGCPEGTER